MFNHVMVGSNVHQILRQFGVKAVADAGTADGPQQMQMLLDIGATENAPAQFGAIVGPLILPEQRIGLEQDPQRIAAGGPTTFDEMQVKTDAARGDEPPAPRCGCV